jgi:hypothetical protein
MKTSLQKIAENGGPAIAADGFRTLERRHVVAGRLLRVRGEPEEGFDFLRVSHG